MAVKGHDSKAEFEKNVKGVSSILAALPAGAKVTVIGITDDSFATPYIILSAELTGDEGYFKERLANGRVALMHAWQERSARLAPRMPPDRYSGGSACRLGSVPRFAGRRPQSGCRALRHATGDPCPQC